MWKAYQTVLPCQNFPTGQLAKPGMYYQQKPKILTKWPPVATAHHCPLWHEQHHWGISIPGIPSDLWSRPEQNHHLPRLCSSCDYRQPIEFPTSVTAFSSTKRCLFSLFVIKFSDCGKKRCDIWQNLSPGCGIYLSLLNALGWLIGLCSQKG